MEYRCKVTVLDKKLFPELQAEYCAVPDSGKCPCYNVGDEFVFCWNSERDDFWHCGAGTLVKSGKPAASRRVNLRRLFRRVLHADLCHRIPEEPSAGSQVFLCFRFVHCCKEFYKPSNPCNKVCPCECRPDR